MHAGEFCNQEAEHMPAVESTVIKTMAKYTLRGIDKNGLMRESEFSDLAVAVETAHWLPNLMGADWQWWEIWGYAEANPERYVCLASNPRPPEGTTAEALIAMRDHALETAYKYGSIDGDHHKMWVIDQMVRQLSGSFYEDWVAKAKAGENGPDTYSWDEGIAP